MKIRVKVKTGRNEAKVIKKDFAEYEVWLRSTPVKGAANRELVITLANYFSLKKYRIRLVSGLTSPMKIIELVE